MTKAFKKYDPFKHRVGSIEHFYYWEGVTAGGDMAKDEVQSFIDELADKNKPIPYEFDQIKAALRDLFEDK